MAGLPRALLLRRLSARLESDVGLWERRETVFRKVVVSTSAAEGLFGRLKAWIRKKAAKRVSSNSYGGLLASFCGRQVAVPAK